METAGEREALLPCPFCGGPVQLEQPMPTWSEYHGERQWWGVVCRNTLNRGGTCAIQQRPSASKEAAIDRWNLRAAPPVAPGEREPRWICLEGMNVDELAAYDYGCASMQAALQSILDGKDSDEGAANEPWESMRRRVIALVRAAKAQAPAEPVAWQERQGRRINKQTGEVMEWSRWYECSTPLPGMPLAHTNSDDRIPREWRPLYAAALKAP